ERVSPPAADVFGQRGEHRGGRAGDLSVQCYVYGRLDLFHGPALSLDGVLEPQQRGREAGRRRFGPPLVQLLPRNRVQVVPAVSSALAAGNEPPLAHDP